MKWKRFEAWCAVLLCAAVPAVAQRQYPEIDPFTGKPIRKVYHSEIGVRYGGWIEHRGPAPDWAQFGFEYARYNPSNLGFRTGIDFLSGSDLLGIQAPVHFSWHTRSFFGVAMSGGEKSVGDMLLFVLTAFIPKSFELHGGLTPAWFGKASVGPYDGSFVREQAFGCSADVGGRMTIPIWRFRLSFDCTYHYMLTRNYRDLSTQRPAGRSYLGLSGVLTFTF